MNIEISPVEYERELNWDDGMMYCQLLIIDGKNDWRMPTLTELDYIWESKSVFGEDFYWSSTNCQYNPKEAWYHGMEYGLQDTEDKHNRNRVRAVRTINN